MEESQKDSSKPLAPENVLVIGAGPSGLTAALELLERGVDTTVVESDHIVGGISRTESYRGYRFDKAFCVRDYSCYGAADLIFWSNIPNTLILLGLYARLTHLLVAQISQ